MNDNELINVWLTLWLLQPAVATWHSFLEWMDILKW